jgi:hypothetical protein
MGGSNSVPPHGEPIAGTRATAVRDPAERKRALERLVSRRIKLPPGSPSSVELLNMIYDDPEA